MYVRPAATKGKDNFFLECANRRISDWREEVDGGGGIKGILEGAVQRSNETLTYQASISLRAIVQSELKQKIKEYTSESSREIKRQ